MSPELSAMLAEQVRQAVEAEAAARALGAGLIAALPFKVGDELEYSSGVRFRVHRVAFELHCYMRGGVWQPGYSAMGPQTIGTAAGSTSRRALFDITGQRAVLTGL